MKKKIMAALTLIAVTFCLSLCIGACGAFQKDETIEGHWVTEKQITQLGDMKTEGQTGFNITINEDGTMTAVKYPDIYTGVKGSGTWKEENGVYKIEITYEDQDVAQWNGTIDKKHLTLTQSNSNWGISVTYVMVKSEN